MRHPRRIVLLCLLATLAGSSLVSAPGFRMFQHGGRATGQVGAFTARASEPSALTYNPAAITKLSGTQLQAGLDFNNSDGQVPERERHLHGRHIIQFPPAALPHLETEERPLRPGPGQSTPPSTTASTGSRGCSPAASSPAAPSCGSSRCTPWWPMTWGRAGASAAACATPSATSTSGDNGLATRSPRSGGSGDAGDGRDPAQRQRRRRRDRLGPRRPLRRAVLGLGGRVPERRETQGKRRREVQAAATCRRESRGSRRRSGPLRQRRSARSPSSSPGSCGAASGTPPIRSCGSSSTPASRAGRACEATDVTYSPNPSISANGPTVRTPRDWKDTTSLRLGVEGRHHRQLHPLRRRRLGAVAGAGRTIEPGFPRGDATDLRPRLQLQLPPALLRRGLLLPRPRRPRRPRSGAQNPGRARHLQQPATRCGHSCGGGWQVG